MTVSQMPSSLPNFLARNVACRSLISLDQLDQPENRYGRRPPDVRVHFSVNARWILATQIGAAGRRRRFFQPVAQRSGRT